MPSNNHHFPAEGEHEAVIVPLPQQHTSDRTTRRRRRSAPGATNVIVRGERHDPPDAHKLARVMASLAADTGQDETDEQPRQAQRTASRRATTDLQTRRPRAA
ncbi:hypothetical protein [Haloechinothrix salitolerans]|uniref:Uncharacterized protein n=1 Tax=Haloechinothrix salitolerans TaxID=926830 RepID=A0ABW2BWP4_9PSEU